MTTTTTTKAVLDYKQPGTRSPVRPAVRWLRERWGRLLAVVLLCAAVTYLAVPRSWGISGSVVRAVGWLPLAAAVYAAFVALDWLFERLTENNYKTLLIGRYLRRRRIAWVSLIAVTLCSTMVLVVLSVMSGWLEMFKSSFHGLTGDVIVESRSLSGFPHYEEMLAEIENLPEVEAAAPTIGTFGILNVDNRKTAGVQVLGFDIARIGKVNRFTDSLWRQRQMLLREAERPEYTPTQKQLLIRKANMPPQFKLRTETEIPLPDGLPAGVALDGKLAEHYRYDPQRNSLVVKGVMTRPERDQLKAMSADAVWRDAVDLLYALSDENYLEYRSLPGGARGDPTNRPGLIPGGVILDIRKGADGEVFHDPIVHMLPAKLTVMGMGPAGSGFTLDVSNKSERVYWIVDDSWTGIWQYDANFVYVPFEQLQADLGMAAREEFDKELGRDVVVPARTTDIQIKLKPGHDLEAARDRVRAVVEAVAVRHGLDPKQRFSDVPAVETWEEDKALYINAIKNETVLMMFLFGIISVVAVFLIFCIFYMIVAEKTKDIGIIKSVGASAGGVAGIFLGYGAAIGVVGAGLGLLLSYLIVSNINELHSWLARVLRIQIWNPEVYQFDKIPNTIDPVHVAVIVPTAIMASVVGALVPALRAATMHPVEALRWE